jgi:hypothetical protein
MDREGREGPPGECKEHRAFPQEMHLLRGTGTEDARGPVVEEGLRTMRRGGQGGAVERDGAEEDEGGVAR